jgi:serine/threonine-protein kinase RsbW
MKRTRRFPNDPQSVPAARRFADRVLSGVSAETLEAVELMVSELATNCIRHTDSDFDLTIIRGGGDIRVEATDAAGGAPKMRSPKPTDPSGRGLKIVDMLSATWGVERRGGPGKTVWFTIAEASPAPAGRAARVAIPTAYPSRRDGGPTGQRCGHPVAPTLRFVRRRGEIPVPRGSVMHGVTSGHDPDHRGPRSDAAISGRQPVG